MGNCYSGDYITEDHIHTDITCNTEEPQQEYFKTVTDYCGARGFYMRWRGVGGVGGGGL